MHEISDAALDSWYSRDYKGFYVDDLDEPDIYGEYEDEEEDA